MLDPSPGDTRILLSLSNQRIKKLERGELNSISKGVEFHSRGRFELKRLRSIRQMLEKHLADRVKLYLSE